ncbi:hypothetical protein V5799_018311 [Amblyomma americanum]|uniref:Uncharacterized protein n=1 Tax=Amblyomma americanum TaxID=6943 RepID=A0AAQ4F0T9_AMBAM
MKLYHAVFSVYFFLFFVFFVPLTPPPPPRFLSNSAPGTVLLILSIFHLFLFCFVFLFHARQASGKF